MIKIRSTEKKAMSNTNGLCNLTRQMLSYKEDFVTGKVTIVIQDTLFQEKVVAKTIEEAEVKVTERKIIEKKIAQAFTYDSAFIDDVFSQIGFTISKTKSYTEQSNDNKLVILIAQTSQGQGWQGMNTWIPDTEYQLVNNFTEI